MNERSQAQTAGGTGGATIFCSPRLIVAAAGTEGPLNTANGN